MWTAGKDRNGYGGIKIAGKQLRAHRVAWEIEYGPVPDGMCVLHRCDTPACVNPEHLFLGTMADNMNDKEAKGRGAHPFGAAHSKAKLEESDVQHIRASSQPAAELAAIYGLSLSGVYHVINGRSWRHVK